MGYRDWPDWNPHRPTVPVDKDGNFLSCPTYNSTWKEIVAFPARMRIVGHERGQSAFRFILENIETGARYSMFGGDMVSLLKENTITNGETEEIWWIPSKKGQNFGLKWKP